MEATIRTPTGVPVWVSLGQHRSGPDGGPVDGEDVRLRCPEGHTYVSGPRERNSGEIECPACGEVYCYAGRDRLWSFLEEEGWIERFREVGRSAGFWAGTSTDDFPIGFNLPGFAPEDVRERIYRAVGDEAREGRFIDWSGPEYPVGDELEPWRLGDDLADVLVPFRLEGWYVPSRPLRQLQFTGAQVAMGETDKGHVPSPRELVDQWLPRIREALLEERETTAKGEDGEAVSLGHFQRLRELLRARHAYSTAEAREEGEAARETRQDAKRRLERLWREIGVATGLLPDVYGRGRDPFTLLPEDVLRKVYDAGKALARELQEYDPVPDARKLAEVEPLPQGDLVRWARVLHLGGLLTPEEIDTLLRPLPGPEKARNDSTRVRASIGLPVVRVVARRLGLAPAYLADRLDLSESVKAYLQR